MVVMKVINILIHLLLLLILFLTSVEHVPHLQMPVKLPKLQWVFFSFWFYQIVVH